MMADKDKAKELLEKMLADLYGKAASDSSLESHLSGGSYLQAADGQFLGSLTANNFDENSILNGYGPFGSPYSGTSIFNIYGQYGGQYGQYSPENPYTTNPPTLFINNRKLGRVSANSFLPDRIPYESFIYSLRNDLQGLLRGKISKSEAQTRTAIGDTFIQAADGTFLGSLNPSAFDVNSLFNKFGEYGNRFSSKSIFNPYSPYGGAYSALSPFNRLSAHPPEILSEGKRVAFLTKNMSMTPRVDPDEVLEWARSHVKRRI